MANTEAPIIGSNWYLCQRLYPWAGDRPCPAAAADPRPRLPRSRRGVRLPGTCTGLHDRVRAVIPLTQERTSD